MEEDKIKMDFDWEILGEYFFNVGIALVVAGAILLFTDPSGIFISGVIILLVGVFIRSLIKVKRKGRR